MTNPDLTAALAHEHRADLLHQAEQRRIVQRAKDKVPLREAWTRRRPLRWLSPTAARAVSPAIDAQEGEAMPLIQVTLIECAIDAPEKATIIERLTDAMVSVEGEAMRSVT